LLEKIKHGDLSRRLAMVVQQEICQFRRNLKVFCNTNKKDKQISVLCPTFWSRKIVAATTQSLLFVNETFIENNQKVLLFSNFGRPHRIFVFCTQKCIWQCHKKYRNPHIRRYYYCLKRQIIYVLARYTYVDTYDLCMYHTLYFIFHCKT
jgi:hypothetical protein